APVRQPLGLRPAAGLGQGRLSRALPAGWSAVVPPVPARLERNPDGLEERSCADARRRLDADRHQVQEAETAGVAALDPNDATDCRLDRLARHLQATIRLWAADAVADVDPAWAAPGGKSRGQCLSAVSGRGKGRTGRRGGEQHGPGPAGAR